MTHTPQIGMIVLTDNFATISRLVEHLAAQTIAGDIELVIGCPSRNALDFPPGAASRLARLTIVEVPLVPMGEARAAAVRATTARIVALGETHAFPSADWAAQLIRAFQGNCHAVAPGVANGNPATARSWSGFLMDYGRWLAECPGAPISVPPTYNAVWRREVLVGVGESLASMLEPGGPIDHRFFGDGSVFRHVPEAGIAHLNVVSPVAWVAERYWGGRLFGARRCRHWSWSRRLIYLGGSALVPALRFIRTRPAIARARSRRVLPFGTVVAVAAGCLCWAYGEAMGYLAGEGHSEARMCEYELHKAWYA